MLKISSLILLLLTVGVRAADAPLLKPDTVQRPDASITLKESELVLLMESAVAHARAADADRRAGPAMQRYQEQLDPKPVAPNPAVPNPGSR